MSGPGIVHADLSDLVPTSEFIDMTHLMPQGNQRVADALAERIAPIVREQVQVREVRRP